MRFYLSTAMLSLTCLCLMGCDEAKKLQEKIDEEIAGKDESEAKAKPADSSTTQDSANPTSTSDYGSSANEADSIKQSAASPKPSTPQFPDLAADQRPAAEALSAIGGKLKIENGVVTELSLRGLTVERQHLQHVFRLTNLKKLDLATPSILGDMLDGVATLRELQFIDLSGSHANVETFVELLKIPSLHFMVFDQTEIDPTAFNTLVRDNRKLTLSLRGMDSQFTDEVVLRAFAQTRRRVTFVTDSGVLPAGATVNYPVVAGVQTGGGTTY